MRLGAVPPSWGVTATRVYTPRPWNTSIPPVVANVPEKFPLFHTNQGLVSAEADQIPLQYGVQGDQPGLAFAGVATAGHEPRPGHTTLCGVTLKGTTEVLYLCDLPVCPGEFLVSSFLPHKLPYIGPLYGLGRHVTGSVVPIYLIDQYLKGADEDTVCKRPRCFASASPVKFLEHMGLLCATIKSSAGTFYLKEQLWVDDKRPDVYVSATALSETDLRNLFFYELAKRVHEFGTTDENRVEEKLRTDWITTIKKKLRYYKTTRTVPREPVDYDIGCVRQHGHFSIDADITNFNMFAVVGVNLSFHCPTKSVHKNFFPVIVACLFG